MRKKSPPETGSDLSCRFLFVFALLVCNTTRCFASRLTGCLAFATAAVFYTCSQITGIKCLNVFHVYHPFAFTDVFSFKTYLFVFYHKKSFVSSLNQKMSHHSQKHTRIFPSFAKAHWTLTPFSFI